MNWEFGKILTSKIETNCISLTCKQLLEKKTLNGKILMNCKEFIKFVNISPVKILCHMVLSF